MAAQLMEAAHKQQGPALSAALGRGDYAPLREWLKENVWQHGRRYLFFQYVSVYSCHTDNSPILILRF